jgi:hypothetical protein
MRAERLAPLLCLAVGSGCFDLGLPYRCEDDRQCVNRGVSGRCVAGFCSFPVSTDTCASGWQYGADAPPTVRNQCVVCAGDALCGPTSNGRDGGPDAAPDLAVDLAGADLAVVTDGAMGPDAQVAMDLGADLLHAASDVDGACGTPQLLVTVENLDNGGVGAVHRFHVPPFPQALVECAPLTGSGQLDQLPEAVAPIGPDRIAVAGRDRLSIVDTSQDQVVAFWAQDSSVFPFDVAPISHGGETYVAVAGSMLGSNPPYLFWLDLYKEGVSGHAYEWIYSDLGVSSVVGMTVDTQDPTKLFIADNRSSNPVYEESLDPFAPATVDRGPGTGGNTLISINSVPAGGGMTMLLTSLGLLYAYEGPSGIGLAGPISSCLCSEPLHAVPYPDPLVKAAFVLCDDSSPNRRTIQRVRYDSISPQCSTVFRGSTLTGNMRLSHLGYVYP